MKTRNIASFRKQRRIVLLILLVAFALASGGFIGARLNDFEFGQQLNRYAVDNPLYRWLMLRQSSGEVMHARVGAVDCPKEHQAIAIFGQSNSANQVRRSLGPRHIDDGRTFMWDWTTRSCYPYAEPVAGTDGEEAGNIITATIQNFRALDPATNLIVVAFGRSATSVFSWSHGIASIRLDAVLERLSAGRIAPALFLWHQGEADAIPEMYLPEKVKAYGTRIGSKKMFYALALDVVVQKLHAAFPGALVGVALASVCNNEGSQEIRDAQKAISQKYPWVAISADTDRYGGEYRTHGCHFNENGEKHIAADYLRLVVKSLAMRPH